MSETLYRLVRDVPDFPRPGILFRDITPILLNPLALVEAVELLARPLRPLNVTRVVAIESRGFLLGAPVALALGVGLAIIRKPGKLPVDKHRVEYALEYGSDALELHTDALRAGDRAVIVDDVLATGGTAAAAAALVELSGATVASFGFLIELADLDGRRLLGDRPVYTVLRYPRPERQSQP
ncbi:MAG: adenine phosphoribosyltransferase [Gemmatimonadetes bacterium GWC2_71_9]|nr:MAG: adenine phosphoribosyltransferase [Gemmatimonadetes bacterium GWC2_71_9]